MPPFNLLYLHSHDTGRYIQPYGYPVSTPNLQKFAEEGITFRQAFCASPTCSPSRAALLTGQYPHCCGMHGLASPGWGYQIDDPQKLLMNFLAGRGYITALAGVQHLAKPPDPGVNCLGYELFLHEDDQGEDVPDAHVRAAEFIGRFSGPSPWFLSVGFDETHRDSRMGDEMSGTRFSKHFPYDPERLDARYCRPPPIYPDLPEIRRDFASYQAGVSRLDQRIGEVLSALDRSAHRDNTLVIVTTDHGIAWPGMKCNLTDHGLGVMLLLRGPGGFTGGRVIDAMVSQLDLFPTLCELLGTERPPWLQGVSLLPLVQDRVASIHPYLFAEQGWHEVAEPQRSVRSDRYKLIRRFGSRKPLAANCDESPTKRVMKALGWFDRPLAVEQCFDLYLDPQEMCDRSGDPAFAPVRDDLRRELDRWMIATQDPLLSGNPVPPPRAASAVI